MDLITTGQSATSALRMKTICEFIMKVHVSHKIIYFIG